jgi:prepilin-type N-terminal cleavage/methylation domain-containing protein
MSIKIFKKRSKGFSLVETLVAITILLTAIGAPMTIAQRSYSDSRIAKNRAVAIFLAQEAIEYVRNVRDTNNIQSLYWLENLNPECSLPNGCTIDSTTVFPTVSPCPGDCPVLRFDNINGYYGYNPLYDETIFVRKVIISEVVALTEASIVVEISWDDGRITSSYRVTENLLDWHGI